MDTGYITMLIPVLGIFAFLIYFAFKQIEFILVSVKLYKEMLTMQERIAIAVEILAKVPQIPRNTYIDLNNPLSKDSKKWKERIIAAEKDINNLPVEFTTQCESCNRSIGIDYPYCPYCVKKNKHERSIKRPEGLENNKPKF